MGVLAGAIAAIAVGWPSPIVVDETGMLVAEAGGFEVRVAQDLIAEPELCLRVLETLRWDLDLVSARVATPVITALRERTVIWIELQGAVVPSGMSGRGMVFHPSAFWLRANGLDPARAGGVEIVRAADYLDWRGEQPMMVLHELAHAYHHMIGVGEPRIESAFRAASESGLYEMVRRAGRSPDERVRAYAMGNALEYFAELSEAYFGRNDFEPFDRAALLGFDPAGFSAVERAWSLDRGEIDALAADRLVD